MIRRLVPILCLAAGVFLMVAHDEEDAEAAPAQDALQTACNQRVTAFPSRYFNPDAGTGALLGCPNAVGTWYSTVNAEIEGTTPVYFCWRNGTKGGGVTGLGIGNIANVCRKRCVGCNNGSSYQAVVNNAQNNLYVLYASTDDAGPAQIAGIDGGPQVAVEFGR